MRKATLTGRMTLVGARWLSNRAAFVFSVLGGLGEHMLELGVGDLHMAACRLPHWTHLGWQSSI